MQTIRTEFHNVCPSCGKPGTVLYTGLSDRLFGVEGEWQFFNCADCELIWLNPRPMDEDIEKLYSSYYTHYANPEFKDFASLPWKKKLKFIILYSYFGYDKNIGIGRQYRFLGKLLGFIPGMKSKVGIRTGWVQAKPGGRLLDVGCGNGDVLLEMRFLGWDAYGIEPDKRAVDIARNNGLKVFYGMLETADYPADYFDVIYLYNVIEHLPDPLRALEKCKAMLKPGGSLAVWTCSNQSLAHNIFKSSYRGLETPRHFHIFSPKSLLSIGQKAGLTVKHFQTYFNEYIWRSSYKIYRQQADASQVKNNLFVKILLKILSSVLLFFRPLRGDDILAVFTK
jgi:2-polyprenyl-3-methyl-5-hydroxy-6-metoxy-1,4-benzoquinol methylase